MTGRNVLTLVTAIVLAVGMLPAQWGHALPTTDLMVHLDASAIDPNDASQVSGGTVLSWRDQATADGNDNADAPSGHEPTYRASVAAINNMPAVEFIGPGILDDHMDIPDRPALNPTPGGYTVFMVAKMNSRSGTNNTFFQKGNHGTPDGLDSLFLYSNAGRGDRENDPDECFPGTGRPAMFWHSVEDTGGNPDSAQERMLSNTDWNIFTTVLSGTTINGYLNGDPFSFNSDPSSNCKRNVYDPSTFIPDTNTGTGKRDFRIGNNNVSGGDSSLDGFIAEVLVYDSDMDAAGLRLMVEQELGTKYGINVVPEPTTWLLLIMGALAPFVWRFRRQA